MRPRFLVRHGALAAALAVLLLAAVRPGLGGGTARGVGALPACRYDDIMTTPRGYGDWPITLVDTILRVPKSYVPPDLVSVSQAGLAGSGKVRSIMIDDLRAMAEAATAAGNPLGVQSAYRSYDDQIATFAHWVSVDGYAGALRVSARPGHSEHQLGLAIDFRSQPQDATLSGSWAFTPAGMWMGQHAWEYGFIRSYPAKKQGVTCYASEAWHYRYVGRDLAAAIRASGLTIREYLWANDTTAVVPRVTARPTRGPAKSSAPVSSDAPSSSVQASSEPASSVATAASESPGASGGVRPSQADVTPSQPPPGQTQPPLEAAPAANPAPMIGAGIAVAVAGLAFVMVLVLRRGRSGVGL
jgi:D-alanyl-D-alanine carboxypeptidase